MGLAFLAGRSRIAPDHFDKRHAVRRIEKMEPDKPLGAGQFFRQTVEVDG